MHLRLDRGGRRRVLGPRRAGTVVGGLPGPSPHVLRSDLQPTTPAGRALRKMGRGSAEERGEDVGLGEEHLDVAVAPAPGGEGLQEDEEFLHAHLAKLFGEAAQKGSTNVRMKIFKAVGPFGQARVPQPHNGAERELAHQEAVHPSERELQELDALFRQVVGQRGVDASDQFLQPQHHSLDARLAEGVVVLDVVE